MTVVRPHKPDVARALRHHPYALGYVVLAAVVWIVALFLVGAH